MEKMTRIEHGLFIKLFNRNGYVLDFNDVSYDAFTMSSIGEALKNKYNVSKGQSLIKYIGDTAVSDEHKDKLLSDLFEYYETLFTEQDESWNPDAKKTRLELAKKCRCVIDRIKQNGTIHSAVTTSLKNKFSSDYISSQIDMMVQMQNSNPTEAIGKAKELIESCCKTILEANSVEPDKKWDIVKLVDETTKMLKVTPKDIADTAPEAGAIKAILGNLKAIAQNVAQLRNSYGSGHGKSASFKGLEERHARLAIGSSTTLVYFLWDSYEKQRVTSKKQES